MAGITKIFWGITLFLIVYAIGFDFPISGDTVFLSWIIFYFIFMFYAVNNKTQLVKDPKTGTYKEITVKKSLLDQESELRYLEVSAREQEKLRQKHLSQKKQDQIKDKQRSDKQKVITGHITGLGLMDKIKRLKKLYINGTLTKAEFEQAKNKLLK